MKATASIAAFLALAVASAPADVLAAGTSATSTAACQATMQAVETEVPLSPAQRQEMLRLCSGWASQWGAWRALLPDLCRSEEQALQQVGDGSAADQLQQACTASPATPGSPSGAHTPTPLAPAGGGASPRSAVSTAQIPSVSVLSDTTGKCWILWWFCDHYAAETDDAGNGLHVGAAVVQSGSGDGLLLKLDPTSTFVAMNNAEVAATASSLVRQLQDAGAQVAGPVVSTVADSPLLATGDIQAVSLIASLPGVLSEGVDSYEALGLTGLGLTSAAEASKALVLSPDLPASVAKMLNGVLSGISSWEETHDFWPALGQDPGMLQTSDGTSYSPTYIAGPGQALLIYIGGVSGSAGTQKLQIDPALTFVDTGLSTVGNGAVEGQGLLNCQASPCTVSEETLTGSLVLNPV